MPEPTSESSKERDRWNQKYRESPGLWLQPDDFLEFAFNSFIRPRFPHGGTALDLAGGAGRHSIWLAGHDWHVTLMDISEVGVNLARQNAGPLSTHIHFVVHDLTRFTAPQTQVDLVMVFCYLDREIFPEILKAIRPGGLLVYKTHTREQLRLPYGPKNITHLLDPGELPRLAEPLQLLHYKEVVTDRATAELVAAKMR